MHENIDHPIGTFLYTVSCMHCMTVSLAPGAPAFIDVGTLRVVRMRTLNLLRWTRATWVGWLLGVPFIIVLALMGDVMGVGGWQVLVGAGLGAGVGLLQGRAIRPILGRSGPWFWACVIGISAPFLAWDLATAAALSVPFSPYAAVGLGGLLAGVWQARLLRDSFRNALWWVAASTLGWTLAGGTAAIADWLSRSQSFRGIWGALGYLAIVGAGGLILGLVTGLTIVRNQPTEPLR